MLQVALDSKTFHCSGSCHVCGPILLKRVLSATIKECCSGGVFVGGRAMRMSCLRAGIKTFETATRNTLTLRPVALVKELSHCR